LDYIEGRLSAEEFDNEMNNYFSIKSDNYELRVISNNDSTNSAINRFVTQQGLKQILDPNYKGDFYTREKALKKLGKNGGKVYSVVSETDGLVVFREHKRKYSDMSRKQIKQFIEGYSLDPEDVAGEFFAFLTERFVPPEGIESQSVREFKGLNGSERFLQNFDVLTKYLGPNSMRVLINHWHDNNYDGPVQNFIKGDNQLKKRNNQAMTAEDRAMKAQKQSKGPGGIDFTGDKALQVNNDGGQGIKFHLNPAMLQQLQNAPGFVPVIINIQPMTDLRTFLGLTADQSSSQQVAPS
jgi:hypothetical protein